MNKYEFSYLVNNNSVELTADGNLFARIGPIRKITIPLTSLTGLYIKYNESSASEQLILGYEIKPGKKKKISLYANEGASGLKNLVEELVKRYPHIDLQDKGDTEALKILGTKDTEKIAMLLSPLIVIGVVAILTLPMLIHGLDSGHSTMTASELISSQNLESRNITLKGVPLDAGMQEKTTSKGTTTVRVYIPIIDLTWRKGQPIGIILETGELSQPELSQLLRKNEFKTTVRNVMWEGPSGDQIAFFKNEYGLTFIKEPILVKQKVQSKITDLTLWILIMSIVSTIMISIGILTWFIRYRK